MMNQEYYDILVCPICREGIYFKNNSVKCSNCGQEYSITSSGQIDFRLNTSIKKKSKFTIGDYSTPDDEIFAPLTEHANRTYSDLPNDVNKLHLSDKLIACFPIPGENNRMLDLGCGDCVHKNICEELGFNWMGIDYSSDSSPLLGDTHSLPFDDNSFDFVLSIAVMEHVHNPFLMVQEVKRVLKSDGVLIGSVAFLEDFHGNSMYHHTRLGTYQTLKSAGLNVKVISPYEIRSDLPFVSWDGPIPQVRRLFPGLPLRVKLTLLFPVYLLDYILFKLGYFIKYYEWGEEYHRKMGKAGQYAFIATNN